MPLNKLCGEPLERLPREGAVTANKVFSFIKLGAVTEGADSPPPDGCAYPYAPSAAARSKKTPRPLARPGFVFRFLRLACYAETAALSSGNQGIQRLGQRQEGRSCGVNITSGGIKGYTCYIGFGDISSDRGVIKHFGSNIVSLL